MRRLETPTGLYRSLLVRDTIIVALIVLFHGPRTRSKTPSEGSIFNEADQTKYNVHSKSQRLQRGSLGHCTV